ncbi:glycoside hydrolase family 99-like domain-containing protein [Klebsiella pneumoniae]|nr:glycoside hydrolase family 99-like domain-containing protein [Klebsiella pneumoniae]HDS7128369.1 glycoside hydrolase family 99-like domain-containing protein [Klebsiella pneumoniae subsp. ozaenae]EIX9168578.1 glycoside hydrolase family 99-like domain-containing protein [Klebsiella pneumoniae]EKZ9927636.1 glycoside hydrolase family 99-like domain-containing protein [Klebsiella pneumoniae]MBG2456808.1 glycoside hydrolase family 99-like domain-containing protein [Klebsiella pneumoniae]MBK27170
MIRLFLSQPRVFFIFIFFLISQAKAGSLDVGVYYYPGWNKPGVKVWEPIKKYPEREPILGWYQDGDDNIIQKQLAWMEKYGVTYIAYDWYWDENTGVKNRTFAIDAYLRNSQATNVKFALLWANHTNTPKNSKEFDNIVNYWIDNYFKSSKYFTINRRPVVFVFSPQRLEMDGHKFNMDVPSLLKRARLLGNKKGLKDIYFVASTGYDENNNLIYKYPPNSYDAVSAYNYHIGISNGIPKKNSYSYQELIAGYKYTWNKILSDSDLPYIIPVSSGWDRRPWGGSIPPEHDMSYGNPKEFGNMLSEAKEEIKLHQDKALNNIIICCWNEYGEGSYIEPSKKYGFKFLDEIQKNKNF